MSKNGSGFFESRADWKVGSVVSSECPNFHEFVEKLKEDVISVKFSHRGSGEWLGIAKRYGGDGSIQVCFAGASDIYSCLVRLDLSIKNCSWKADKFSLPSA